MNAINRQRTEMDQDTLSEVLSNLKRDYGFKERAGWLRGGKCPKCGEMELYTHAQGPWVVKCGRENNCGWTDTARNLYPDSFGRFNERYPATTEDPNRTADKYLQFTRGFPVAKIKGWYRQGEFVHSKGSPKRTATVVFDVDRSRNILMERLIDPVRIKKDDGKIEVRKANFVSDHRGLSWEPPGQKVTEGELFLVEGCLKAIGLALKGYQVSATLSCVNFPTKLLESLDPKKVVLVWALDNDPAGHRYIRKHVDAAKLLGFECRAALIPAKGKEKLDWDDAYRAGKLEPKDIDNYRFHGDLLLAETPTEKGVLTWLRKSGNAFAVEHRKQIYWFSGDYATYEKILSEFKTDPRLVSHPRGAEFEAAMKSASVQRISNCAVRFLYFMRDELADESWYYARVEFPHGRHTTKSTFRSAEVSTSSGFKDRLLKIAPGALWTGGTGHLNWIVARYLDDINVVKTVEFIGYAAEHKAWIFSDKAVANGQVHDLNEEDFFEIGNLSIKSLNGSLHLHIGKADEYDESWITHLYTAFGVKGIIAAAFWLGSLFAEQIRVAAQSMFFMEIVGEYNSGKSTLIEFLWKLVGRPNYEGFDPNASTPAARGRMMTQVANLPVCLIESDREKRDGTHGKQFNWDELKTLFNGRSPRNTAVKNGGNDTKEPAFRGSIVISQNAAVESSDAIMSRIVHLFFTTAHHSDAGKAAAMTLARMPVEKVSHFLLRATTAEKDIVPLILKRADEYEAQHSTIPELKTVRIQKNHGQARAMVDALATLVKFPDAWRDEAHRFLIEAAKDRQRKIAADHQLVTQFWDVVDFLGMDKLDHSRQPGRIAINLNHFQREAMRQSQQIPDLNELRKLFPDSRTRPLIEGNKAVNSGLDGEFTDKTIKCWVFANPNGGANA
ncbi:MAG: toprim domain-containing protein [Rhodospirillaceae bacterium]|nr:toprim domain-containing protein [Rhodospirillales bacterium]